MSKTIELTVTDEQFAAMQSGGKITFNIIPPKKVWEPSGDWCVDLYGDVFCGTRYSKNVNGKYIQFGNVFPTKKAAEKAAEAMRRRNRLLAYVAEFGGDWEDDWDDMDQRKYYVFFGDGKWHFNYTYHCYFPDVVYMSKECAEGLEAKLNSGEVVL